ncbi:hypothetical protein CPB86DRAFT_564847 [Serendipita vermifera]|nr:hypothetical protein CPB86DRAFT_564847 [Serendipita vermifera]
MTTGSAMGARAAVPYTFGATLVVYLYLLRQKRILERQKVLIEEMLIDRGEVKPRVRMRDVVAGVTVAVVSGPVTALSGVPLMENAVHAVGAAGASAIAKHSSKKKRTNSDGMIVAGDDTDDSDAKLEGIDEADASSYPAPVPPVKETQQQTQPTTLHKQPDVPTSAIVEGKDKELKGDKNEVVVEAIDKENQATISTVEGDINEKKEDKEDIYRRKIEEYRREASKPTSSQLKTISPSDSRNANGPSSEKTTEGRKQSRAATEERNTERKKKGNMNRDKEKRSDDQNLIVLDPAKDDKVKVDNPDEPRNPLDSLPELTKA